MNNEEPRVVRENVGGGFDQATVGATRATSVETARVAPRDDVVIHRERQTRLTDGYQAHRELVDEDRIRWGPVVAGLLASLTALILLTMLGIGIGLTAPIAARGAAATGPGGPGANGAVWAGVIVIISFFIGGFVAGRSAAVYRRSWGAMNGMTVFLLAVPILLYFVAQGVGAVASAIGPYIGRLPGVTGGGTTAQVSAAAGDARTAAWGIFIGIIVALIASGLGGALGTRILHRDGRAD